MQPAQPPVPVPVPAPAPAGARRRKRTSRKDMLIIAAMIVAFWVVIIGVPYLWKTYVV